MDPKVKGTGYGNIVSYSSPIPRGRLDGARVTYLEVYDRGRRPIQGVCGRSYNGMALAEFESHTTLEEKVSQFMIEPCRN